MGKRSNFERLDRDFYPTPKEAVQPLLPFLNNETYLEPCAGDGALIRHLGIKCLRAFDIEPQVDYVKQMNCFDIMNVDEDLIITNPPWDRNFLHPFIDKFRRFKPTWLLFDADWMHTRQSSEYVKYCSLIISVGRVKWIPDSKMTGKDNCCWYLFGGTECSTKFVGR